MLILQKSSNFKRVLYKNSKLLIVRAYSTENALNPKTFENSESCDTTSLDNNFPNNNDTKIEKSTSAVNNDTTETENQLNNDQNDEEIEKSFELIEKGMLRHSHIPKYQSLTAFNDKADKVPNLTGNLSSTLFSPGVHYLTDPRTGHVNFDKSFLNIPHIDDFKMDKISHFTPSSRDTKLLEIADSLNERKKKKRPNSTSQAVKYFSSTSSMTSILTKFHKILFNNRPINTTNFSRSYPYTSQFTRTADVPTSLVITPKDVKRGIYSVDADRSTDSEITLSILGNALELMLTKTPEEFNKYLLTSKEKPEKDENSYHYAKIGKFLVRSQLDAIDPELPGNGTFDIKTRAVCAIRFDISHTDYYPTNYEINRTFGLFESFERELFDAARIVMFKYSLQARLGNMDGIFMAFHNIKKFLGFQYLPLHEIDNLFFGDYSLSNKYGKRLFEKDEIEEDSYTENKSENDKNKQIIEQSNQSILQEIINDFGNHHQTKREVLSSYVADYELKFSMNLFERLLDQITKDTKGKPFRIMTKNMKTSFIEEDVKKTNENIDKLEDKEDSIVFVVNTLEEEELSELQMLSSEKIDNCKALLKRSKFNSVLASDRTKFFSENITSFQNKYFKINRSILKNSTLNNGFFAYKINIQHIFNEVKDKSEHPFPSIDILDPKNDYKWDINFAISRIEKLADKQYLFNKLVKNVGLKQFRTNEADGDTNVYPRSDELQLDSEATELQNIMRAYSVKALKRRNHHAMK